MDASDSPVLSMAKKTKKIHHGSDSDYLPDTPIKYDFYAQYHSKEGFFIVNDIHNEKKIHVFLLFQVNQKMNLKNNKKVKVMYV